MLDAAKEARGFVSGKMRSDLDSNRQLTFALVKDIEIIGEAVSKVSQEMKAKYPALPWFDIIKEALINYSFNNLRYKPA